MSGNPFAGDSALEREFELETAEEEEEGAMTELEEPFAELSAELDEPGAREPEREQGYGGDSTDFVERFMELGEREFESESDLDSAVNGVLHDIEREYFFKGLTKRLGGLGKQFLQQGLKTVGSQLGKNFPAVGALTQLARGNLKGMLAPLAKTALSTAFPGIGAAMPALSALGFGFEASEDPQLQRQAWQNYVTLAREAYEGLASNLSPDAADPLGANRLASAALRNALARTRRNVPARGDVRRIQVRRGQRLIIEIV